MGGSLHLTPAYGRALRAFIDTINAKGGVCAHDTGAYSPACDEEWTDLGEAYMGACMVLNLKPVIHGDRP